MQVNALQSASRSLQPVNGGSASAKAKQDLEALGNALDSGNLTEAKKAFAQLQKDASSQGGTNSPSSDAIDSLGKALDSGDLKSAQEAYAKVKNAMPQQSPTGGAAGGARGETGTTKTDGGSSSNKVYDVRDTNKDGVVSAQEELEYALTHPQEAKESELTPQTTDQAANDAVGGTIDFQA